MKHLIAIALATSLYAKPPTEVPKNLSDAYTLGGSIPILSWYRDDSYAPEAPIVYTKAQIDANIEKVKRKETNYYGMTDRWLYSAIEAFRDKFTGKRVAIIGSVEPWYEAVVLAYGGIPTTIEYNTIISEDPRVRILLVDAFDKNPETFDVILSISSWEHDGLGRYGDPINPNGDLEAMKKARSMLAKEGILILAVPVGRDALVWNVHRIYGSIRLPMLLKGWETLASYGFSLALMAGDLQTNATQPVFVLKAN